MGNANCCASTLVPGGTFNRSNAPTLPATVSDFHLDVYEVTVGRYRRFLQALPGSLPAAGSGRNPHDPADGGWDPAWSALVETNMDTLRARFNRIPGHSWTDEPGANEALPMNCISWYEAAAFCIFDEGRLPTNAESNYAAAGGAEQRIFPWSVPPTSTTVDMSHAVYGSTIATVGSKSPKGDGRWGHADLAGNVFEWVQDYFGTFPVPCVDCALHVAPPGPTSRIDRGGSVHPSGSVDWLRTSYVGNVPPGTMGQDNVGVRCARSP
jgi:formylglycine-generating enzyme